MKPFIIQLLDAEGNAPATPPRSFELPRGRAVFIGRNADSDFVVLDSTIGKPHAMLTPMPTELAVMIVDARSSNGVFVDGERKAIHFVKLNQKFRLGERVWFRVTD